MMWGQLAIKAALSGVVIAAASELARRNVGWGGFVASLPLTTLLALAWLWRDAPDPARAADFMTGTALYVIAALPSFLVIALALRRGTGLPLALAAGSATAIGGYLVLMWLGRRFGLPV
ncbi:DUF3147 family protein [Novosphingobium aquiterrae]|uniref:DUF3147 family protein n=1 Tax=Novosphingobium aquiterrae TaxID=624388 RepID=A0ABV6PIT4_9SPHN